MDIGNSLEELLIKCNKKIYLLFGNKWIDVLDADGNLNVRVKNIINFRTPTSSTSDGFYYDGTNVYLKAGSDIINLSEAALPEGSIIMYEGNKAPNGWNLYSTDTGFNNTIYIINKSGSTPDPTTPDKKTISLNWTGSVLSILRLTVTLGESFTTPILLVSGSDNQTTFKKKYISYSSSDGTIATASKDLSGGLVLTPLKEGTTLIYARTDYDSESENLYTSAETYFFLNVEKSTTGIITVDLRDIDLEYQATSTNVGITCDTSWRIDKIEFWSDDNTWCTATKLNNTTLKINVTENETDYNRVASIILNSDNYGATITVILAGKQHITPDKQTVILNWTGSVETNETLNVTIGESFSTPNLELRNEITGISWTEFKKRYIEYSSFDESIATVSKNSSGDLQLTIVGPGSTRILAETIYSGDALNLYTTNRSIFYLLVTDSTTQPSGDIDSLDTIIDNFNSAGISPTIPKSGTVYTYLEDMYSKGIDEFDNNTIGLFSESTYPEATEGNSSEFLSLGYRGNNNTFALDGTSKNIMLYWLIATCVAELIPTSGTNTNNQTKLFKTAYDLGKGNDYGQRIPLYNNYTVKADPSIARLAATELYAYYYEEESSSRNSAKTTLNGLSISGSTWDDLGTNADISSVTTILGWIVDTDKIIPAAPGDRISGYNTGFSDFTSKLTGLDSDGNYDVDVAIDDYVTKYYNLYVGDSDNVDDDFNKFKSQSSSVKERVLEAAMIPGSNNYMYFGRKTVKISAPTRKSLTNTSYTEMSSGATYYYHKYNFELANSPDNNTIFDIKSAFYNWEDKMFSGTYSQTGAMNCMAELMSIADNSRFPTMGNQYGRRRPLGGITFRDSTRSGYYTTPTECLHHPLAGLQCGNLMKFFADTSTKYNNFASDDYDDFPHDRANSYPSGHSAQAWIIAMLLSLYDNSTTISNIIGGYRMGVNRSIGRYHWNSDIIYGRLCACMILPIINSMTGGYTKLKSALGTKPKSSEVEPTGDPTSLIIKIVNNTSEPLTLDNRVRFMLDDNGTPYRTNNIHFIYNSSMDDDLMNLITLDLIPSGGSREYTIQTDNFDSDNTGTLHDTSGLGKNFSSNPLDYRSDYLSNAILYINLENSGDSVGKFPSTAVFNFGYKYTLLYGGSGYVEPIVPVPTGDSVNITLNITNNSSTTISCTDYDDGYGRMSIMSYGRHPSIGLYYYYRPKGRCNVWSLAPGESTTVNVLFSKEVDSDFETWMIGYLICPRSEAELGGRHSNIAFYSNRMSVRLKALPDTGTFSNGAIFTTEYNNDIHNAPGYYNDDSEWIPGYEWTGGYWV